MYDKKEELQDQIIEIEKERDSFEAQAKELGCLVLVLGALLLGSWGWFYF